MRKTLVCLIIGLFGSLFACANPNIGKQFPPGQSFTGTSGRHVFMGDLMTMEYDYRIDRTKNKLILEGNIRFTGDAKKGIYENPLVKIEVYFLDSNFKCVRVGTMSTSSPRSMYSPIKFKTSFPYDPSYRYVNLKAHISAWY